MNKLYKAAVPIVLFLFSSVVLCGQSKEYKNATYMDIQSIILRTLDSQYVDSVEIDRLLKRGIDAMLSSLDPYTVFIPQEESEDLEMMTTGSYGGVGATIQKDSTGLIKIVEPYMWSPAVKYGLEPGDLILSIDGTPTAGLTVSQASGKMRGSAGSLLGMSVIKGRGGDTLWVSLERERVHIPDVVYSGFLDDTTGYIQIGGFTMDGAKDVRKALVSLKKSGNLKRLVLDLRGNGGGLMSEAVDIVSLFVPKERLVVSARGKHKNSTIDYYTDSDPVDTEIPLLVMVNSGSASSSEIVAGALQDMDRAVIAGVRTYGKGLVQTIRNTGFNTSLKLTTAKYYTPSGRCVQAIDYSHRNADGSVGAIPDSLKREFKTEAGRSVYDGGGIMPDIEVPPFYYPRPVAALLYSGAISDYAIEYYKNHQKIAPAGEFVLNDGEYEEFVQYASRRDFDHRSESLVGMDALIKTTRKEMPSGEGEEILSKMNSLRDELSLTKEEFLRSNKSVILPMVRDEIVLKYYFQSGGVESSIRDDRQLHKAVELWDVNLLKPDTDE